MRILVLGAYGLIGSHIIHRLNDDGHQLVGLGRRISTASRRFEFVDWVEADIARLIDPADWTAMLDGVDGLINCAGVLQTGLVDNVQRLHVTAMQACFRACQIKPVRLIVQISAIGAATNAPTSFMRTKAEADAFLASLDIDWIILRPALVIAPDAYGGTALIRALASLPAVIPRIDAAMRIQTVSVTDVAETVARCVNGELPARQSYDLAHPEIHTFVDLVAIHRQAMGQKPARIVGCPNWLVHLVGRLADGAGLLGWRSPLRTTALRQLAADVVGDPSGWIADMNIRPESLSDSLRRYSLGLEAVWFGRLYALKPLIIAALSTLFIASGIIAVGPGFAAARDILMSAGIDAKNATGLTLLGGFVDIIAGFAVLVRPFAKAALAAMAILCLAYLVLGTLLVPALWADPLAPLVKIGPVLVLVAIAAAILKDR